MIEFIGPLYNLLHFTNHYLQLDTLDFWLLYTNPLLQLNTHILTLSLPFLPPSSAWVSGYVALGQTSSTVVTHCCRLYLATGCLPRICLHGKVFVKPLLSNGHMCHNILKVSWYLWVWCVVSLLTFEPNDRFSWNMIWRLWHWRTPYLFSLTFLNLKR
jgi:hypothetical protein